MRTNPKWARRLPPILALGVFLAFGVGDAAARAEESSEDPEYGSTFGRVRYLEGSLTLQRTADSESTDATVNDPVVAGDRLLNGDGRAEIGLSDGSTVWLDVGTRLYVRNLADLDNRYESTNLFALEAGAIRVDAPDPENKNKTYRVDTEAGSVYLLSGGSFRIETDEGSTTLYSFRGVAELSGDDGSVLVRSGERSSVQPGRVPSEARRFNTARLDDFDRFCESRLEAYLRRDSDDPVDRIVQEVPQEVHPYISELSYYGSWRQVPDYGWVWRPVYSGSWGPYVNGYWSWCRTGWVWVSNDPWGWAPYHYGRWDLVVNVGWVWIPGRVWSGAWVSFAAGPSHIGWCPLNYYNRPVFQDITIVNVVKVNVTRLQPRGWRFVPVEQFTDRRSPRSAVRVDRLPRGTDLVITSRLPRFDPHEVGGRQDRGARFVETVRQTRAPLPVAVDRDNRPLPFRSAERSVGDARGRRDAPEARHQENPRLRQPRPAVRPGDAQVGPGRGAQLPGAAMPPRGRLDTSPTEGPRPRAGARDVPGTPDRSRGRGSVQPRPRVAPPARDPGQRGAFAAPPARDPAPREGPRSEPRERGRGSDARKPDVPRDQARRPSAPSNQPIEKLVDGVRGERGRPRVEAPRAPSSRAPRPEAKPQRQERPPQAPPAQRSQPKPQEDSDKGR